MRVNKIEMEAFGGAAPRKRTEYMFPRTGLTLVTGSNGSGKSTLIEAVSFGLWGEPVRTDSLVHDGREAYVGVDTNSLSVQRTVTAGGKKALAWRAGDAPAQPWETMTHAQKALTEIVGTQDNWLRTHVFTGARRVADFLAASPGDRRLFLERLIDLGALNRALQLARDDLRLAHAASSNANMRLLQARAASDASLAADEAADLALSRYTPPPPAPPIAPNPVDQQQRQLLEGRAHAVTQRYGAAEARARLRPRAPATSCVACGRQFDNVEAAQSHYAAEVAAADAASHEAAKLSADLAEVRGNLGVMQAAERVWMERTAYARAAEAAHASAANTQAALTRDLENAEAHLVRATEALAVAQAAVGAPEARVRVLEKVEEVLGPGGLRAKLLDDFLAALSAAVNSWLYRIFPGLTMTISGSRKLAKGTSKDEITVTVSGAAASYGSASTGQQRRMNVAVLLALSDLADDRSGTLWFDEVFDALDNEGVELVLHALADMAKTRPIVAITHHKWATSLGVHEHAICL